jgi:3-deoxy-manno-octulosonate cytidylyltransferase (CMP-KDO synthetase)
MSDIAIIVPARLASTRFPEKLLHCVRGKPILLWVAERLRSEAPDWPVWFAVDDRRLAEPLEANGFRWTMTRPDHPTGTDRLAEANRVAAARYVINVQADEPLVTAAQIRSLAHLIATSGCPMATLATPFRRAADFANPNQVKVVTDRDGRALYFSRSPIPFPRDLGGRPDDAWVAAHGVRRHLGLYAYEAEFLERFVKLPPGQLEQVEKLEQLRALENGFPIAVGHTDEETVGIDTAEDAEAFEARLG